MPLSNMKPGGVGGGTAGGFTRLSGRGGLPPQPPQPIQGFATGYKMPAPKMGAGQIGGAMPPAGGSGPFMPQSGGGGGGVTAGNPGALPMERQRFPNQGASPVEREYTNNQIKPTPFNSQQMGQLFQFANPNLLRFLMTTFGRG